MRAAGFGMVGRGKGERGKPFGFGLGLRGYLVRFARSEGKSDGALGCIGRSGRQEVLGDESCEARLGLAGHLAAAVVFAEIGDAVSGQNVTINDLGKRGTYIIMMGMNPKHMLSA